ncbi:MAG: hypothetical protein IT449_00795 [Phycisphaerales bacterium]|nr:hypothetical protein [Phycisphaerales bacterium]
MKYVAALMVALILNAAANLMMKVGMKSVAGGGGMLKDGPVGAAAAVLTSPVLLGGLICFGLNAFCYMYALQSRTLKISLAYPIMVGGGYAIIATFAYLHPSLKERLTPAQWLGVALVLAGVMIIAVQTPSDAATTP